MKSCRAHGFLRYTARWLAAELSLSLSLSLLNGTAGEEGRRGNVQGELCSE